MESGKLRMPSGELFSFREHRNGTYIIIEDELHKVFLDPGDVDSFCEALKAFRDEVTKPKMTGGEKVFAARRAARKTTYGWSDCSPEVKAYYQEEARLLGIKDDE